MELNARNVAAHEIISIDEKWFKDRTGHGSFEILKMLKEFISYCTAIPKDAWKSYDNLNQQIIDLLTIG